MNATRRVVVTGAAAGVGLAVSRGLLDSEKGYPVEVIGVDLVEAKDDLAKRARYTHVEADVRKDEDLARVHATVMGPGSAKPDDVRADFERLAPSLTELKQADLSTLQPEIGDVRRELAADGVGYADLVGELGTFDIEDDGRGAAARSSDRTINKVRAELRQFRAGLRGSGFFSHLILAAGGSHKGEICPQDPLDISEDVFQESVDLNLTAQYQAIRHLVPAMRSASGEECAITTVSSINALGSFGAPAYSLAKGGLSSLVRSLADPLGQLGIRINNVLLGTVDTESSQRHHAQNGGRAKMLRELSPLGNVLTPEQAADILIAVTMTEGATGQDHVYDNGQSLARRGSYIVTG